MIENDDSIPPDPDDFTATSPAPANDAELAVLCDLFEECGIARVVVHYQGSGDEGSVAEVEFEPPEAAARLPDWTEDKLREVAEGYCPDGYENNEGGYGTLTVYPSPGLAELEHSDCYEDAEAMDEARPAPLSRALRQRLARCGVTQVTAHFGGFGDSGQLEELAIEPASVTLPRDLADALEDFLLEQLPLGWEINDGSSGDFTVDVAEGTVAVDASWRTTNATSTITRWKWRPF